jgi:hypothetical protein
VIRPYLDLLRLPYAARLAASTALYGLAAVGTFVPIVLAVIARRPLASRLSLETVSKPTT